MVYNIQVNVQDFSDVQNATEEIKKRFQILNEVIRERVRQDQKWGQQNHDPFFYLAILGEEFGEASKAALKAVSEGGNWKDYREELVQVTAVALAMIECYDRNAPDDHWYLINSDKEIVVEGTYEECFNQKSKGVLIVHERELHCALY